MVIGQRVGAKGGHVAVQQFIAVLFGHIIQAGVGIAVHIVHGINMGRNVLQVAVHFPLIQPYTPHFAIGQVALVHIKAIVSYRDIRGIYRIHYLHAVAHKFFGGGLGTVIHGQVHRCVHRTHRHIHEPALAADINGIIMHKIVGIGDVVQRFLNGLPVLLLRGNTLGHIFGGECLGYRGHCAGSPRREHDDNAEEDGNTIILDLYIGACGVNQHLNAQNDQHHRGILYHAEHIDIRHKNPGQLDGTDGNQHQAKAEGTHPPHFDRGFGGRFGRGLRGGFLAGILAGILGRFLRHRDILVKIVFHS